MSKQKMKLFLGLLIAAAVLVTGCDVLMPETEDGIKASGVVEAEEISVSAEIGGTIVEMNVGEGCLVEAGDLLFRIEGDLLDAQFSQAKAALETAQASHDTALAGLSAAEAGLESAHVNLEIARIGYQLQVMVSRGEEFSTRVDAWNVDIPDEFEVPVWYFDKSEVIEAAQLVVDAALDSYNDELSILEEVRDDVSNRDIRDAEARLAKAQAAFLVAEALKDREVANDERDRIEDYVDTIYDDAKEELESAQSSYESLLSEAGAEDLLEARARVRVAYERYQIALDNLYAKMIGDESLQVDAAGLSVTMAQTMVAQAEAAVAQAQAGVVQAEKGINQAQTNIDLMETQLAKLFVTAPAGGTVLTVTAEEGEIAQPGMPVITIGQLDNLTITVYVLEDRYGKINLGDKVDVDVDSFPGETFRAEVTRIADRAEYTPRNVQTEEERRTTVFAIELSVIDPDGKLKPGMPADVSFD